MNPPMRETAPAVLVTVASPVSMFTSSDLFVASMEESPLETTPMTNPPTPSPELASPSWSTSVRVSPLLAGRGGACALA
jgi:hypothetical protein